MTPIVARLFAIALKKRAAMQAAAQALAVKIAAAQANIKTPENPK